MNDKMLVGVMHRGTDLAEEREPCGNGKVMTSAIHVNSKPLDILHDEKRNTIRGNSSAIEMGDVRIVQAGEDLFFVTKSRDDVVRAHRGGDKFQRTFSAKMGIFREIHIAHPAAADERKNLVIADRLPGVESALAQERVRRLMQRRSFQKRQAALIMSEQRLDFTAHN